MKRWGFGFSFIALAAFIAAVVTGCGGSSGSSSIHGEANINSLTERPKVAIVGLDNYSNWVTKSCSSIRRSSGGWQDVPFSTGLPEWKSYLVYTVVAFNDRDNDNRFDSGESLGFMDHFLETLGTRGEWIIAEGGVIYSHDATQYSIYIDCIYSRMTREGGPTDEEDAKKLLLAEIQKVAPLTAP